MSVKEEIEFLKSMKLKVLLSNKTQDPTGIRLIVLEDVYFLSSKKTLAESPVDKFSGAYLVNLESGTSLVSGCPLHIAEAILTSKFPLFCVRRMCVTSKNIVRTHAGTGYTIYQTSEPLKVNAELVGHE